jgi:hypothetical protein
MKGCDDYSKGLRLLADGGVKLNTSRWLICVFSHREDRRILLSSSQSRIKMFRRCSLFTAAKLHRYFQFRPDCAYSAIP